MSLQDLLERGKFVVAAQLRPPRGAEADSLLKAARKLKGVADVVTVADNGGARLGMSPLAAAALLKAEGLEVVVTLSCRDRNRLALQADLLGAAALGLSDVLLVSGDHPSLGDQPSAQPVYDLDSVQLLQTAGLLMAGADLGGRSVSPAPRLFLGAAANPAAQPIEPQLLKLEKKMRAGARYVITQPVFDLRRYTEFLRRARSLGLKVLSGVRLLCTEDLDRYERHRLPGHYIPAEFVERVRQGGNGGLDEGVAIAAEVVKSLLLLKAADGIHFMDIGGREELIPTVLKQAGL